MQARTDSSASQRCGAKAKRAVVKIHADGYLFRIYYADTTRELGRITSRLDAQNVRYTLEYTH
jgi:hypothetical protein